MKTILRDLRWILPVGIGLGLPLSLFSPGNWGSGWLGYGLLCVAGLLALSAAWRSAGSSRSLLVMLIFGFSLRLGLGVALTILLPEHGNDTFIHNAGYAFRDAYTYDNEAWDLAASGQPLWRAFDSSYGAEDQYGGLLFTHSLFYRFLSPDAHRPWLLILLSAFTGALGVGFAWQGSRLVWSPRVAGIAAWILALYPESLLVGASQVREPFLVLFTAVVFWSLASWLVERRRGAWAWLAGSLVGMGIFSPAVVLAVLLGLGVWTWLRRKDRHISRWLVIGALALLLVAALLLGQIAGGTLQVPGGPLSNLVDWLRYSILYSSQVTALHSGWLQSLFDILPDSLELPFITAYGIAQPVLPAAAADPAVWPVRLLGILRGLGWYALLPLLVYSLRPILKTTDGRERGAWTWLWLFTWAWIIIASARAGGDQWDNPRYRVILLLFQAFLAAYSLDWQQLTRDRWLGRILAVEAIFLVCFGYWYTSRYSSWNMAVLNVTVVIASILVLSALVLLGGLLWDRRHSRGRGGGTPR